MKTEDNDISSEAHNEFEFALFNYLKIFALGAFLPMLAWLLLNEGAVLWKAFSWMGKDIDFWALNKYRIPSLLVALFPLLHLIRFNYKTIRNALRQLYKDFIKDLIQDMGASMAELAIELHARGTEKAEAFELEKLLMKLNQSLSELPKILEWLARKVLDQVPLIEFVNSYDVRDLEKGNEAAMAKSISKKIDETAKDLIESVLPGWAKFIIPANLILLVWYITL